MDSRPWHYVKHNRTSRLPRRHIYLDTEAVSTRTNVGQRQRWRLGVAKFTAAEKGRRATEVMRTFTDPRALWPAVSDHCRARSRTVLWAHNLGYDVRIAEAFTVLPELGWRLVGHNMAPRGAWLQWRRDETSLVMVDSCGVYPTSIEAIGQWFDHAKEPLPSDADDFAVWQRRCQIDVEILATAVQTYLAWLEREDLGNWQLTGAGQSYAAFRHRFMAHELLVHGDAEALAAERRAMWAGRCEAYFHGRTGYVGVEEWDMQTAYARIARDNPVPIRLRGRAANPERMEAWLANPSIAILAETEVDTTVPVLPTVHDGRILWPVGHFTTTVWDPELRLALATGARLTPRRIWIYQREPALHDWAAWIINRLASNDTICPPWMRTILRHWSRALIGRFAMHYQNWAPLGSVEELAVRHGPVYDTSTGVETMLTQIGRDIFRADGVMEWDQSMPAITGYIASLCRVDLWHLLHAMGPRRVLYADTDSIMVSGRHAGAVRELAASRPDLALRLKTRWRGATIYGPRQIITDERVRVAGVPTKAQRLPSGKLAGEVWSSLAVSLRRGQPGMVEIRDRRWTLRGIDRRRTPGPDGWTVPVHIQEGSTT